MMWPHFDPEAGRQDDRGGRQFLGGAHDLSRIHRSVVDRAPVYHFVEDQRALLVENVADPWNRERETRSRLAIQSYFQLATKLLEDETWPMSKRVSRAVALIGLILICACNTSARQEATKISSLHRFGVGWELHYGYFLEDQEQHIHTLPTFKNEAVRAKFDSVFSNDNLAKLVGKRIYCDCQGYWVEERFHVTAATLSAE